MTLMKMSTRGNLFCKFLSALLVFSFVSTNLVFAEELSQAPAQKPAETANLNPDNIIIPKEFGMVKAKFTGKTDKLVINIQDAHCNYEAQTNIANIVETLVKNDSLKLVSVEGADGIIDTSWFKAFPDAEVRKEVATYFMKKGEITGPEFLSITTDYPITLFGAETRDYYIQNLDAFTSSYSLKEATETYYNQIKSALNKLKGYIYNDDLKLMDAKMRDYESKKLAFNEYVSYLGSMAEKLRINIREYDNLFKLISTLAYEKKIDFKVVDKERSAVIDELSKKLAKDKLTELVSQSLAFKTAKISAAEYYDYLKDLAAKNGIDITARFKNLATYIIYNALYSKIENEKLFADIKKIEAAIREKLFTSDDQRTLEKLSRHIDILLGLVNIKLLNEDFDYYKAHKDEFAYDVFTSFLSKEGTKYGLAYEVEPPSEAVSQSMAKLEDFYAIAIKRNEALIDNTLAEMGRQNTNISVLVTGGFHTEGMCKLLEEKGVSYMVICPTITKDVQTPYIQILLNQRTSFEDILVGAVETTQTQTQQQGMLAPLGRAYQLNLGDKDNFIFKTNAAFKKAGGVSVEEGNKIFKQAWATLYWDMEAGNAVAYSKNTGQKRIDYDEMASSFRSQLSDAWTTKFPDMPKWARAQILFEMEAAVKRAQFGERPAITPTPGLQPTGRRVLSDEQAAGFDGILRESFDFGEAESLGMKDMGKIGLSGNAGRGFVFVVHDKLVERIDEYNKTKSGTLKLGHIVHPGRGPEHRLLQAHIDKYIFDKLMKEDKKKVLTIARHELAHLDIFNVEERVKAGVKPEDIKRELGEEAYATWQKWSNDGKPTAEAQEEFVNKVLGYDVTEIAKRIEDLAKEKRDLAARKHKALPPLKHNLSRLQKVTLQSQGAPEAVAIVNEGDDAIVGNNLNAAKPDILKKDNSTLLIVHPEVGRRGQLLGLLDAMRGRQFNRDTVSLGIMLPGQGTRMAPITASLNGIKPFLQMLIRTNKDSNQWLTGAEASLYTWNLVVYHLQRLGFRGIAWKWGDEPQVASLDLDKLNMDLSQADFVRFGSETVITDDLAENKEWLNASEDGTLIAQVRRRGRKDLLDRLNVKDEPGAKAMVHIGSPAFSYIFIEEAEKIFGSWKGWIDVDGYLCEALTQDEATWNSEYEREMRISVQKVLEGYYSKDDVIDVAKVAQKIKCSPEEIVNVLRELSVDGNIVRYESGRYIAVCGKCDKSDEEREKLKFKESGMHELNRLIAENNPDLVAKGMTFYKACQELKANIEKRRGHPMQIKVINFGEDLYWGDIGQLSKAREALHQLAEKTPEGDFARVLAAIEHVEPDKHGNIVVGKCVYPRDGSVRNSVLINTRVYGVSQINNAVLVNSVIGDANIAGGAVVYGSTVVGLTMGRNAFSFKSICDNDLNIPESYVHTSMPKDLSDITRGFDDWWADQRLDVGADENYKNPKFNNQRSFEAQQKMMRQRAIQPETIEAQTQGKFAVPLSKKIEKIGLRYRVIVDLLEKKDLAKLDKYISGVAKAKKLTAETVNYIFELLNKSNPDSRMRTAMVVLCNAINKYAVGEISEIADSQKKMLIGGRLGVTIDPDIFRRDSVRAVADVEMPDALMKACGASYVLTLAKKKGKDTSAVKIGVGRESRPSGGRIINAFNEGAMQAGATVIDATAGGKEITSTPIMYFASRYLEAGNLDGIIEVTASHLPVEQNGLKPTIGVVNFTNAEMDEWREATHDVIDKGMPQAAKGAFKQESIFEPYRVLLGAALQGSPEWLKLVDDVYAGRMTLKEAIDNIRPQVEEYFKTKPLSDLKIAADSGFGSMGPILRPIMDKLGAQFADLGPDADYNRSYHDANPNNPDNLVGKADWKGKSLLDLVTETGSNLGTGFDVDGDRLGVATLDKKILRGDDISCIMAPVVIREAIAKAGREGIKDYKPVIVVNVLCSERLKEVIRKAGGIPIESAVGFNKVKEAMVDPSKFSDQLPRGVSLLPGQTAEMGVEISSHIMFKENFNADDAFFAVVKLLAILKDEAARIKAEGREVPRNLLDVMLDSLPADYHTGEWRTPMVSNQARIEVAAKMREHYERMAKENPSMYAIRNTLDGIKIDFLKDNQPVGWLAIRPSGTSAEIVVAINSLVSPDVFNAIKNDYLAQMVKYKNLIKMEKLEPGIYVEQAGAFANKKESLPTPVTFATPADKAPVKVARPTPGLYAAAIAGVSAETEAMFNAEETEREALFAKIATRRSADPQLQKRVAVIAIDNSIYTGPANPVLTELEGVAKKFGGQLGVVVVRGTGDKLFEDVDMAIKNARAKGLEVQKVVTQLSSKATDELRNKLKGIEQNVILNIDVKDKALTSHYLQVLRLFNLSLQIAYEFSGEEIKATLEKIDPKFGSMSADDIAKMIASKILEILPAMRPIDTTEALAAYKARQAALHSL